jgi:hypothetical protein
MAVISLLPTTGVRRFGFANSRSWQSQAVYCTAIECGLMPAFIIFATGPVRRRSAFKTRTQQRGCPHPAPYAAAGLFPSHRFFENPFTLFPAML